MVAVRAREHAEEQALLRRQLSGSSLDPDEDLEYELEELEDHPSPLSFAAIRRPKWFRARPRHGTTAFLFHSPRRRHSLLHRTSQLLILAPYIIASLVVLCGIFFPSYAHPPLRYAELRQRVLEGGTANVNNEKVFIAASLYDHRGELLSGQWGQAVLQLIDILGPRNVFLSIYENDPDIMAQAALDVFSRNVTSNKEIVTEKLDLHRFPHVATLDGTQRLKRIAFLADVRNRALRPLQDPSSAAFSTRFDKLLYLNDVMFDPIDAANLLFSTGIDENTGRTQYRATCAVDFINPFKFYDTFATRDLEGYNMGVPFYPWFTGAGKAESRKDVLAQKDAVRVKSCWGGMVAFEAKWFQSPINKDKSSISGRLNSHTDSRDARPEERRYMTDNATSLRFRAETDTYWDASECCLIHADLTAMEPSSLPVNETGIYMNPYIRVAYSSPVLAWLSFTRRFERLYTPIHTIVDWIAQRPSYNPRQFQQPGDKVTDFVWTWDDQDTLDTDATTSSTELQGHYQKVHRIASPGGFCGVRRLLYLNEQASEGESKWTSVKSPPISEKV